MLKKFAWKPILNSLKERENFISDALNEADRAKMTMAQLKASNEDLLKEAREERDHILKLARESRDAVVADAKGMAHKEASKILQDARETINSEKMVAIMELKNQVATLSIEIAEKILRQELSSEDKQKALIANLLNDVSLN